MLLLSAVAVRPAEAQIGSLIKVNFTFDVTVGGMQLPSGQYTIQSLRDDSGSSILMFRADNGKAVEVLARQINTPDNSGSARTAFVVGEHGGERSIDTLWIAGQAIGYDFTR